MKNKQIKSDFFWNSKNFTITNFTVKLYKMNKNGQFSLTLKCDTNAMYLASFLSNYVILILNYKIVHEKVSKIFVIFKSIFCLN